MDITEKERWAAMEARLMARLDRLEAVLGRTSLSPSPSPMSSTTASTPSPPTEAPSRSSVSTALLAATDASTTRPTSTLAISISTTTPIAADTSISMPISITDPGVIGIATTGHPQATPAGCSMVCLHLGACTPASATTPSASSAPSTASVSSVTSQDSTLIIHDASIEPPLMAPIRCSTLVLDGDDSVSLAFQPMPNMFTTVQVPLEPPYVCLLQKFATTSNPEHAAVCNIIDVAEGLTETVHTKSVLWYLSLDRSFTNLYDARSIARRYCYFVAHSIPGYMDRPSPWPPWLSAVELSKIRMLFGSPPSPLRPPDTLNFVGKPLVDSSYRLVFDPGILFPHKGFPGAMSSQGYFCVYHPAVMQMKSCMVLSELFKWFRYCQCKNCISDLPTLMTKIKMIVLHIGQSSVLRISGQCRTVEVLTNFLKLQADRFLLWRWLWYSRQGNIRVDHMVFHYWKYSLPLSEAIFCSPKSVSYGVKYKPWDPDGLSTTAWGQAAFRGAENVQDCLLPGLPDSWARLWVSLGILVFG